MPYARTAPRGPFPAENAWGSRSSIYGTHRERHTCRRRPGVAKTRRGVKEEKEAAPGEFAGSLTAAGAVLFTLHSLISDRIARRHARHESAR